MSTEHHRSRARLVLQLPFGVTGRTDLFNRPLDVGATDGAEVALLPPAVGERAVGLHEVELWGAVRPSNDGVVSIDVTYCTARPQRALRLLAIDRPRSIPLTAELVASFRYAGRGVDLYLDPLDPDAPVVA